MQQLIRKELILQKKMLWFGFFYSIFLFFVFANPVFKNFIYSMCAFGVSYITIIGIAQVEYQNHSDIIMNSLPTTRREIVGAKYLSIIICTFIALIMTAAIGLVFHQMPAPFDYRLINPVDILITFVSVSFLAAVSLPIYHTTSAQWVRIANIVIFMVIFFAPAQIAAYIANNSDQAWMQTLFHLAYNQSWLLIPGLLTAVVIILLISYYISLSIYLKKDF